MIIMAVDHTREFFGAFPFRPEDLSQTSALLFLTRLITHLCAPAFILLAGISIYLRNQRDPSSTPAFVWKRGVWLVILEIAIMSLIITHGYSIFILGILWTIGLGMIITSVLIRVPHRFLLVLAILIITCHHLLPIVETENTGEILLALFYHTPFVIPVQPLLIVAYTILPWLGVMLLGYCIGPWFQLTEAKRKRNLQISGAALLLVFTILRFTNLYGDLVPWSVQDRGALYTFLSFLNVTKYPASLLFICLTIGVTFLLLSLVENARGWWTNVALTFGQVPLFFYILHFALLSAASALWSTFFLGGYVNFAIANPTDWPVDYSPAILRVYVIWIIVLIITYFPARWFASYKRKHGRKRWLSYL